MASWSITLPSAFEIVEPIVVGPGGPAREVVLLNLASKWEVKDMGEAPTVPDNPKHVWKKSRLRDVDSPRCCQRANETWNIPHGRFDHLISWNIKFILEPNFIAHLNVFEFFVGRKRTLHQFQCPLFVREYPGKELEDWTQVVGFLPLVEKWHEVWPHCLVPHRPEGASVKKPIWKKFKSWALQFDASESLERYIALALIAIAQRQATNLYALEIKSPEIFEPRLILYRTPDKKDVYLYKAKISKETLKLLRRPWKNMQALKEVVWPVLEHRKIPLEPYHGFYSRLMAELGVEEDKDLGKEDKKKRTIWNSQSMRSIRSLFKKSE
ncbi:hypothetical protein CDD82_1382 [Ophiocordyceps australis]|uniref:Uncharacterized protein n=1 Tax=Ophiocordyceps australis TaxID=1399860 RepID=A0A2C5ZNX7_9HYPO|nr:hypothetical protein CDD82_1382 [Ophiocordyceps australis]